MGSLGFSQNVPGVSISFDHVLPAAASRRGIDPDLLFLRIMNNSRASIQVLATVPEAGGEGVGLVHEIVENSRVAKSASAWISPPGHYSPINEVTTVRIQPRSDLLFSVPLNHVGPAWRLRIAFQSGSHRQGTADFTWAGIPLRERGAWRSDSPK